MEKTQRLAFLGEAGIPERKLPELVDLPFVTQPSDIDRGNQLLRRVAARLHFVQDMLASL